MNVLGIDVDADLIQRWANWLAPERQPFFLTPAEVDQLGLTPDRSGADLPAELRDTYEIWGVPKGLTIAWLDQDEFHDRPLHMRAELVEAQMRHGRGAVPTIDRWADLIDADILRAEANRDRFVWWPLLLEPCAEGVLERFVSTDQMPCQRGSVSEDLWCAAAQVLPHARTIAGTFPNGSRGNCFGTVMAAAGIPGAVDAWMQREPFETWLADNCAAGGTDDLPGTVLVWRDAGKAGQHAAVTLGDGWALHKPGQEWSSPRQVATVHDLIRTAEDGVTLHRYSIQ